MSEFGKCLVEVAREDLGKGEEGGENAGPFVELCLNVDKPRHRRTRQRWCVGAVMKWLKAANGGTLPCEHTLSSTAFKEICENRGWYHPFSMAEKFSPEPGDIAFVDGNQNGKPDHLYVVTEPGGHIGIGGNEPRRVDGDPDVVKEHARRPDRVIGWGRIIPEGWTA